MKQLNNSIKMNNCSIIGEITKAEDSIQSCYKRVEALEIKLKTKRLPPEQKSNIEKELTEVRKLLKTNEELLAGLHGQNRRTFAVAACLVFVIFLIYGIYALCVGGDL